MSSSTPIARVLALPNTRLEAASSAVPASLVASMQNRGNRKKKSKGERNLVLGNDALVPWIKPSGSLQVYTVRQTLAPQGGPTTSTTLPVFYSLSFLANSLDNFAGYAAVFDQYKIDRIEVLVTPDVTEVTAGSGAVGNYMTAIDYDDATVPTSLSQLGGYASCVESSCTAQHYHSWVPQFAVAAYSGTFTSYSAQSGWIDCAYPNVQYYGLKFAATTATAIQNFAIAITYHISFRATH